VPLESVLFQGLHQAMRPCVMGRFSATVFSTSSLKPSSKAIRCLKLAKIYFTVHGRFRDRSPAAHARPISQFINHFRLN
jgi:hypothetical protein